MIDYEPKSSKIYNSNKTVKFTMPTTITHDIFKINHFIKKTFEVLTQFKREEKRASRFKPYSTLLFQWVPFS